MLKYPIELKPFVSGTSAIEIPAAYRVAMTTLLLNTLLTLSMLALALSVPPRGISSSKFLCKTSMVAIVHTLTPNPLPKNHLMPPSAIASDIEEMTRRFIAEDASRRDMQRGRWSMVKTNEVNQWRRRACTKRLDTLSESK